MSDAEERILADEHSAEDDAASFWDIVGRQFLEVLIAPAYEEGALAVLAEKKNVRVLESASRIKAEDGSFVDPATRENGCLQVVRGSLPGLVDLLLLQSL